MVQGYSEIFGAFTDLLKVYGRMAYLCQLDAALTVWHRLKRLMKKLG